LKCGAKLNRSIWHSGRFKKHICVQDRGRGGGMNKLNVNID